MTARHLSATLLAVLLYIPAMANRPVPVYPKSEDLFPNGPATFIEDIHGLEQVAVSRPEDAAELRRILDALAHKHGDEAAKIIETRFGHVNAAMNPYIVLTSYPAQRDLTLTVNGHHYRLKLGLSYWGGSTLAGYISPPKLPLR